MNNYVRYQNKQGQIAYVPVDVMPQTAKSGHVVVRLKISVQDDGFVASKGGTLEVTKDCIWRKGPTGYFGGQINPIYVQEKP
jgi:hypothetical protein